MKRLRKITPITLTLLLTITGISPALATEIPVNENDEVIENLQSDETPESGEIPETDTLDSITVIDNTDTVEELNETKVGTPQLVVENEEDLNGGEFINENSEITFVDWIDESDKPLIVPFSVASFKSEMTSKVRALGGKEVIVKTAPIVCNRSDAIGCASYPNIITFANRFEYYSQTDKWAVAAHELGHIRHLVQWNEVNSNATYKSLFKSNPEHLADCIGRYLGRYRSSTRSCTASQITFAKKVFNKEFVPKTPMTAKSVSISGSTSSGGKAKATVAVNGNSGKYTTSYKWTLNGKAVGSNSASYTIPKNSAKKVLKVVATVTDTGTKKTSTATASITVTASSSWKYLADAGTGFQNYRIIYPGDFNGDGIADLILIDKNGKMWLYPGTTGGFVSSAKKTLIGTGWKNMTQIQEAADFAGDGKPAIIARASNGDLRLYKTNGKGKFAGMTKIGTGWNGFNNIVPIKTSTGPKVFTTTSAGQVKIYAGNGKGKFLSASNHKVVNRGFKGYNNIVFAGNFGGSTGVDLIMRDTAGKLYRQSLTSTGALSTKVPIGSGWQNKRSFGLVDRGNKYPQIWSSENSGVMKRYQFEGLETDK